MPPNDKHNRQATVAEHLSGLDPHVTSGTTVSAVEETVALTVGRVARLAGVTVRTLHHYDEIGLVSPVTRSDAGYRLYEPADVARLQEVLYFRELGFGLDEVARIVDAPSYRRDTALARQRALLMVKTNRLREMIAAIDVALQNEEAGITMTAEELLEVFGGFDPAEYEQEAEDRWGETGAYAESAGRVARYTKEDWRALGEEVDAIYRGLLALKARGVPPGDTEAMDLAEEHRKHITKWFYECTPEIHAGLASMYVADPRFTASIDASGTGLAAYLSAAIEANSTRRRRPTHP